MKLSHALTILAAFPGESESFGELKSKKRQTLTRYGWQWPKCKNIETCKCGGQIGSGSEKSGVITVGITDESKLDRDNIKYDTKQECLWHITVPKKHKIKMEFVREYGFNVEYHNFCGFDKLHLISGHYGPHEEFKRVARFCGPRAGYGTNGQPWDGARKIYNKPGNMPFWDKPFTFENNKVTIGWDSDQTKTTGGFKLKWWAVEEEPRSARPFDTLDGSMKIMRDRIEPLIRMQVTIPIRVRDRQLSQLHNVLDKLEKAVDAKGPNGEKSCSHMKVFLPPSDHLRKILEESHTLEEWLSTKGPIVEYARYYIGKCKNYRWDLRVSNIYKKTTKNIGRARAPLFG
jgi:hypothetical protein